MEEVNRRTRGNYIVVETRKHDLLQPTLSRSTVGVPRTNPKTTSSDSKTKEMSSTRTEQYFGLEFPYPIITKRVGVRSGTKVPNLIQDQHEEFSLSQISHTWRWTTTDKKIFQSCFVKI